MKARLSGRYARGALFGAAALAILLSCSSATLANPSQIQYGYDPIVDAGGSGTSQSETEGAASGDPAEKVDRASAIVAGILGARQGEAREDGGRRVEASGAGSNPATGRALRPAEKSSPSGGRGILSAGSVWFFLIVLVLSLGLVTWAVTQWRQRRGTDLVDLSVRLLSVVAFLALIILLNGSAGSVLG